MRFPHIFPPLMLSLLAICPANAQTARTVAQRSLPSVVLLIMSDANGQPISLGSGFFVIDGVVATNVHVIAGASQGQIKFAGQPNTYSIAGIVGIDEINDLVLLKVSGQTAPALPIGDSDAMSIGDEVYVAGNPQGLEGTLSNGIVSAMRQVQDHKLLQITAAISPGSSGGPVLNAHDEVIGVAVATLRGGQNLNFAVPSSYLAALMKTVGTVAPLSSSSRKASPVIDALGGRLTDAITLTHRKLVCTNAHLTFSIRNGLPRPIQDVTILFIFHDRSGDPVDFIEKAYHVGIPAGLAKAIDYWEALEIPSSVFDEHHETDRVLHQCHFPWGQEVSVEEGDLSFIETRILAFNIVGE